MTRLSFRLPEWDPRITWTSAAARTGWEGRMRRVASAFLDAEWGAVLAGQKPGALQIVSPGELRVMTTAAAEQGYAVVSLAEAAKPTGYASAAPALVAGDTVHYRVAVTRPGSVAAWKQAWAANDNEAIGTLLGYPPCCRRFFQRVWVHERWMDTTYPMAQGRTDVQGINMLLRWFGVRPVSHLPCAFDCLPSMTLAVETIRRLPREEQAWLREMLAWPALWSSLHGVAEIFTPIFRASVPTDALAETAVVRYHGTRYPAEGAKGVRFPYRMTTPIEIPRPALKNGFSTEAAMHAAHGVLLAAVAGQTFGTVIDLGCGDGALLRQIPATRRVGVECDLQVQPEGLDRVVYLDCTDRALVARLVREERPELVIAQRDRNPPDQFECDVLSYSYAGATTAQVLKGRVAV